jgi:hypothetical protein
MNKKEKEEVMAGLINIGCLRRYDGDDYNWSYKNYNFKIKESATLTDVFKILMRASETLKIWEIKSVLNILN